MPDIHIERNHDLGIARARQVARRWLRQVEQDYGLAFTYTEGETQDVAQFSRAGIDGKVEVTADRLRLEATLGFLFASFGAQIEQKISGKLDALLGAGGGPRAA
ncbi:putative polyhydroxyalkanoate system protein [Variovorax sp. TBS-050B]|uniref:polyhydroxyalkanoic acid system family protein n=1 Tax=Variovorax sp. TBS-050B TaxID=2940551 RepID=UPI002476DB41|nr:polyhydroxyalkanoic acid system family protein [Variovorax sp. TBS-050B]MDH6592379.1 putative polyhydroxyalkanoate system protein [Variovorax sp. TBS-050B]